MVLVACAALDDRYGDDDEDGDEDETDEEGGCRKEGEDDEEGGSLTLCVGQLIVPVRLAAKLVG